MAGWLFLPLLGLFITIFSVIYQLYQGGYFTNSIYSEILDKNSSNYNLGLYNYIIFELAYNIMFIVYACTLLILYINKRSSVPRLMILFYGVSLLMLIIELSIAKIFNFELEPGALKELMKGFVAAAIWIPFFIVSINSKETFTMRLGRITSTAEPND